MTDEKTTDAGVIRALATAADAAIAATLVKGDDGREFIVRRNDFTVQEITQPHMLPVLMPKIAEAAVAIDTAASLIDYVNRFKNPNTVLFASEADNKIVAVIDYHEAAKADGKVEPRLGKQIATLTLRYADQWQTWTGADERLMRHVDYATFLEENQFDVTKPNGADLLEICRDLQVKAGMRFSSSIRQGDEVQVSFEKEDDVSSKGSISLPVSFETTIPVFFGEPPVRVLNWSRRKVDGGNLALGYKMSQRDLTEANEFARIVAQVQSGVGGLTTIFGRRQA